MSESHDRSMIEAAIPHRPPMLLVDQIVERTESNIHCRKTFASSDFFVQGHFPNQPIVPGVILCECALQSGAILLSNDESGDGSVPVATRLDAVKFKQIVRPGDTIDIEVTLKDVVSTAYFLTGKITVAGKLAVRLDFAVTVTQPS